MPGGTNSFSLSMITVTASASRRKVRCLSGWGRRSDMMESSSSWPSPRSSSLVLPEYPAIRCSSLSSRWMMRRALALTAAWYDTTNFLTHSRGVQAWMMSAPLPSGNSAGLARRSL